MARRYDGFSRALARAAVETCCAEDERVEHVRHIGRGGTYTTYQVDLEGRRGGEDTWRCLIARLPRYPLEEDAIRRAHDEVRLLEKLAQEALPFRIPLVHAHVEIQGRFVMVQDACSGVPLRERREGSHDPVAVLARIAAAIHAVDVHSWEDGVLEARPTQRAHVLRLHDEVAAEAPHGFEPALAFVREHLPEDAPGALLHGDLHRDNVHEDLDGGLAVLDWALAECGDPAFDLAVTLNGVRRPFGEERGLTRLLEIYNSEASAHVTDTAVYVHELLRAMRRYEMLARSGASRPHLEQEASIVQGILRRARKAAR